MDTSTIQKRFDTLTQIKLSTATAGATGTFGRFMENDKTREQKDNVESTESTSSARVNEQNSFENLNDLNVQEECEKNPQAIVDYVDRGSST